MRTVAQHDAVSAVLRCLALQDAAIGEPQTEDITPRSIWYGIELDDLPTPRHLQNVTDTTEVTLTTVQASDT
jgi:hypothetical protein